MSEGNHPDFVYYPVIGFCLENSALCRMRCYGESKSRPLRRDSYIISYDTILWSGPKFENGTAGSHFILPKNRCALTLEEAFRLFKAECEIQLKGELANRIVTCQSTIDYNLRQNVLLQREIETAEADLATLSDFDIVKAVSEQK